MPTPTSPSVASPNERLQYSRMGARDLPLVHYAIFGLVDYSVSFALLRLLSGKSSFNESRSTSLLNSLTLRIPTLLSIRSTLFAALW